MHAEVWVLQIGKLVFVELRARRLKPPLRADGRRERFSRVACGSGFLCYCYSSDDMT